MNTLSSGVVDQVVDDDLEAVVKVNGAKLPGNRYCNKGVQIYAPGKQWRCNKAARED